MILRSCLIWLCLFKTASLSCQFYLEDYCYVYEFGSESHNDLEHPQQVDGEPLLPTSYRVWPWSSPWYIPLRDWYIGTAYITQYLSACLPNLTAYLRKFAIFEALHVAPLVIMADVNDTGDAGSELCSDSSTRSVPLGWRPRIKTCPFRKVRMYDETDPSQSPTGTKTSKQYSGCSALLDSWYEDWNSEYVYSYVDWSTYRQKDNYDDNDYSWHSNWPEDSPSLALLSADPDPTQPDVGPALWGNGKRRSKADPDPAQPDFGPALW